MPHAPLLFAGWAQLGRIVLMAAIVYLALVAALRVVGERALAKMSAYDLVVTVALGSVLAAIPLQPEISLTDGLAAIATLLVLQHTLSWILDRIPATRRFIKAQPTLVLYRGQLLADRMHSIHATENEIRAAVRSQGMAALEDCLAVVLESDGNWSVVAYRDGPGHSALDGLDLPDTPSPAPAAGRRASRPPRKAASSKDVT